MTYVRGQCGERADVIHVSPYSSSQHLFKTALWHELLFLGRATPNWKNSYFCAMSSVQLMLKLYSWTLAGRPLTTNPLRCRKLTYCAIMLAAKAFLRKSAET